jgi:hypothetical protein
LPSPIDEYKLEGADKPLHHPGKFYIFPVLFTSIPTTFQNANESLFLPPDFLKISTSAVYMGYLVHIGFFIVSLYLLYSISSSRLLQETIFLLSRSLPSLPSVTA